MIEIIHGSKKKFIELMMMMTMIIMMQEKNLVIDSFPLPVQRPHTST